MSYWSFPKGMIPGDCRLMHDLPALHRSYMIFQCPWDHFSPKLVQGLQAPILFVPMHFPVEKYIEKYIEKLS